ncbi:MAG: hypothetical protein AAB491_00575 [Patescibacteria group bacterium]
MAFGLFKKKEKYIAVFDINSASIGAAIIKHVPGEKPEIIAIDRVNINFLMDVDFKAFSRCTIDSFRRTLKNIIKKFPKKIDSIMCVFSSPWYISQTRIIKIKKDKDVIVNKIFIDKTLENEKIIFKDKWDRKEEADFVEQEIMTVNLNGYHIKNFINKKAKDVEIFSYMSLAYKDIKENIKKEIFQNFHIDEVSFHTFPCVMFNILKNMINIEEGLLMLDISGEFTDLSLIRNNILEETVSFPRGKNFLLREIAISFKTFMKEAFSIFEKYISGHANENVKKKISIITENARNEWSRFFTNSLEKISESELLPRNLFILGEGFVTKEFIKCTGDNSCSSFITLGKPFKINYLSVDSLRHMFNLTKDTMHTKDKFILIESIFADKFIS